MVHKVEESIMERKINLIDVAVTGGVLKRHKASGDFEKPLVAPNMGVTIGPPKNSTHTGIRGIGASKTCWWWGHNLQHVRWACL